MPKDALDNFGRDLVGHPDGQFVLPKGEMDSLLTKTGDIAIEELGISPGSWQGQDLVRIDISTPKISKSEYQQEMKLEANDLWLPGVRLLAITEGCCEPNSEWKIHKRDLKMQILDKKGYSHIFFRR